MSFPTGISRISEYQKYFKYNNKVKEYQLHTCKVHSVGWNCDGTRLASCSFDKTVNVFTLEKDRLSPSSTHKGHNGSVDQLCWHASNPNLLATASGDKSVRVWDVRNNKCVAAITTKGENINITWASNGNTIAVGNKDDLISFIDARNFKIKTEKQFSFEVNEIKWNNESSLFFVTSGQGSIQIFSFPELKLQYVAKAHPGTCICIEMDPLGRYFAIGSADALVSLWDVKDITCHRVFPRLDWPVRTISFSHDGALLASGSEDLIIDIAEVETGLQVMELAVEAPTFTVAWHPKIYLLAYACDDKAKFDRKKDSGGLKVFGFSEPSQS